MRGVGVPIEPGRSWPMNSLARSRGIHTLGESSSSIKIDASNLL
jgi:hypothetical protein